MYNQRMPDARGVFSGRQGHFLQAYLPYGKENECSLPEKAPGRSCSMVVHIGSKVLYRIRRISKGKTDRYGLSCPEFFGSVLPHILY